MIKMIKGTYGLEKDGVVEAMTPKSEPFALSDEREAELVALGVAEKVPEPEPEKKNGEKFAGMKMADLRKVAEAQGVDAKAAKTKNDLIVALSAAEKAEAAEE